MLRYGTMPYLLAADDIRRLSLFVYTTITIVIVVINLHSTSCQYTLTGIHWDDKDYISVWR